MMIIFPSEVCNSFWFQLLIITLIFVVVIDGYEWTGVKLVSISTQWHTHVKNFPVQVFNIPVTKPAPVNITAVSTSNKN